MRTRYQNGNLQLSKRKNRPDVWIYRWRETDKNGEPIRRGEIIGTVDKYPTRAKARRACEYLRLEANEESPQQPAKTFGAVVDRYIAEEIPQRFSTRRAYLAYLNGHIKPQWGKLEIEKLNPLAVRQWIRGLDLASRSKAHIRSIMRRLCDCAMIWGWLELQRNPMELVRVEGATKRETEPRVLTSEEFRRLLEHMPEEPFRTMVMTAMCLGLRCSELLALKWSDFDWETLTLLVQRAVVAGRVDTVKTKYSKTRVPLDPALAENMLNWKNRSQFNADEDWVFASPYQAGEMPYSSWGIQQRQIKTAARQAGLGPIGWHTFRHSYRSWLDETGAPMKVQQELMRHASITTTMNIYGAAMSESKREANSKVVRLAFGA